MRTMIAGVLLAAALALPGSALGAGVTTPEQANAIASQLEYRSGTMAVEDAVVALPKGYRYLDAAPARTVLEQIYGNEPQTDVRGLIFAPKTNALDNDYFVVVTYDSDGHVSDKDATSIDYTKLLARMQKDDRDHDADRVKQGYDSITLVGWAEPPTYDAATHRLVWAKQLRVAGADGDTLNYDVRVLGRQSNLRLTAVAAMSDLPKVRPGMEAILGVSSFSPGQTYTDFRSGDKTSKLTIAAIVGGGAVVAAKTGLLALLLAKAKLILVGLVAIGGAAWRRIRRLLGRGGGAAPVEGGEG